MANYNYRATNKGANAASWIDKLQKINPVSDASPHHAEIHFTQPKAAEVLAVLRPHVTFIGHDGKATHWYLTNSKGTYAVSLESRFPKPYDNEYNIAMNVIDDAVALNWIHAAAPVKSVDNDGFELVESGKGRNKRMQTGWK